MKDRINYSHLRCFHCSIGAFQFKGFRAYLLQGLLKCPKIVPEEYEIMDNVQKLDVAVCNNWTDAMQSYWSFG